MSAMTLFYEHTTVQALEKLLSFVCGDATDNLTLYCVFTDKISASTLSEIADVQKNFSEEHKTVYKNHAVFLSVGSLKSSVCKALATHNFCVDYPLGCDYADKLLPVKKELKKLRSSGVATKIWLEVKEDQRSVYERCAAEGIPVNFYDPQYTPECIAWFDHWLFDKKAVPVNTFTDLIHMRTLKQRSPNCRYGSCLGNTIYVDGQNRFYLCPFHQGEDTMLGLMRGECLQQMFDAEGVYETIRSAVMKRERCVKNCSNFAFCQSGCALRAKDVEAGCDSYIRLLQHIETRLHEVYLGGDLEKVNYVVKNAILNVIAFGTAFFKEGRKENT